MPFDASPNLGRLYGIGLGPGDPELLTVKASRLLGRLTHVFAPKADQRSDSIARTIANRHAGPSLVFHELVYPMTRDPEVLRTHWLEAAEAVIAVLSEGHDVGFITLGDPLLYSTCSYLMRAVQELRPEVEVEVVPGIMALAASAALTQFVLGEQESTLTVMPAPKSRAALRELASRGGRVVIMKLGARLPELVEWLREEGRLQGARLVSRAGLSGERVVMDLGKCQDIAGIGYLSTLLVDFGEGSAL